MFDDELVCASKGLPPALVGKFSTFNTHELVPYRPEYLAGWRAESYAVDLMPAWQMAQQKMASSQQTRCAGDVGGNTHRSLDVRNQFSRVTFKHVLLPVWIAAYRYDNKAYRFLINGQTGEVVGEAPWSIVKIVLFILLLLAIFIGIPALYSVFTVKDPSGSGSSTARELPTSVSPRSTPAPRPATSRGR